jgi:hypothetical protein
VIRNEDRRSYEEECTMRIATIDQRRTRFILWSVFGAYALLLLMVLSDHELWGDEIHSWNIARSSQNLSELLRNSRYEGHPPLWYVVLFTITRVTHDPEFMKIAQAVFSLAMVYLILFASPFPLAIRALIPFGYYFAFEYAALSRRYHPTWFYLLVFLLSNTHLLGLLLALSFCAYRAWEERSVQGSFRPALMHLAIGVVICLPAALQIAPPGDSEMNMDFWMQHWTAKQWDTMAQAPLKAFVPVPDTEQFHFWNTSALLQRIPSDDNGRLIVRWSAVAILAIMGVLLRKVSGSVLFFMGNVLLTAAVAFIFPLNSMRYVGFLYIALLIATWLYVHKRPMDRGFQATLGMILALQIGGGIIAIDRDRTLPFSNSAKVRELYTKVPANALVVTDYWCLNNLSAFLDRPFYCLEQRKDLTFLRWDQNLAQAIQQRNFYASGLHGLWKERALEEVYMISVNDPQRMRTLDSELSADFDLSTIDQWEGAIEAHSNVYLYRIHARSATR